MGELRPQTAGHYSFVNVMARNPAHEQRFRPQYRHRYGIDHDITLMAKTGRVHLLDFDATSRAGLKAWLDSTISLGKGGIHYLSPADEPNLNYPSYAAFSRYFAQMARQVRDDPRAQAAVSASPCRRPPDWSTAPPCRAHETGAAWTGRPDCWPSMSR